jgi:hypothetical protein
MAEIFTIFPSKNLVFRKKLATFQGKISKLKNLNKISKLHALERFFFRGDNLLNYLMHDPGLGFPSEN